MVPSHGSPMVPGVKPQLLQIQAAVAAHVAPLEARLGGLAAKSTRSWAVHGCYTVIPYLYHQCTLENHLAYTIGLVFSAEQCQT